MKKYSYAAYSPCGNDTALVMGDGYDDSERKAINDEIMSKRPNIEQVGFLSLEERKLTMAGGEFCGNAVRCAAYHYLRGEAGELEIEIVGEKVKAGINEDGGVWVELPMVAHIKVSDGIYLCKMNGINHIVVTEDNQDALGVIFCKDGVIKPVVYVPSVGTLFNETACLSGTAAAFTVLSEKSGVGETTIEQPSGKPLQVTKKDGGLIITGEVTRLD